MDFTRYAIFYVPPEAEAWADFCTRWLGWDMVRGAAAAAPEMPPLPLPIEAITRTPRKYGLHGTLKPPFRLAAGHDPAALAEACAVLAAGIAPVRLEGLHLACMGRFLALQAAGDAAALAALAAACVRDLDKFRRPAPEAETARRRGRGLSPSQEANLRRWGYPYVMEDFRFHITLSGPLEPGARGTVLAALDARLPPLLPAPVAIRDIALAGEAGGGAFRLIRRFPLGG